MKVLKLINHVADPMWKSFIYLKIFNKFNIFVYLVFFLFSVYFAIKLINLKIVDIIFENRMI